MGRSPNVLVMVWQAAMAIKLEGDGEPLAGAQGEGAGQLLEVGACNAGAACVGAVAALAWGQGAGRLLEGGRCWPGAAGPGARSAGAAQAA
jgi:hypothetical protein